MRVPEADLEKWRATNKEKCEQDALMPKFSEGMKFACATKTHFCHSQKLTKDGGRSLLKTPIDFSDNQERYHLNADKEIGAVTIIKGK